MELLGREILKMVYRVFAAMLLLFLVMSFWASAPATPNAAGQAIAPAGASRAPTASAPDRPEGLTRSFSEKVEEAVTTLWPLRSAWWPRLFLASPWRRAGPVGGCSARVEPHESAPSHPAP